MPIDPIGLSTAADTKNRVFYCYTWFCRRVRMVDLKRSDFGEIDKEVIGGPLDDTKLEDIRDLTPQQ